MEYMKTHLNGFHHNKGYLINFAGFEMPLSYDGIIPEHLAVRNGVGVFDVTHMGRCLMEGPDSVALLNQITARDISYMSTGQGRYSLMCNERGGIIDDIVILRLEDNQFMTIYNASNRLKDWEWMTSHARNLKVHLKDVSNEIVLLAVQGPKALSTLQKIVNFDLSTLRYWWGKWASIEGQKVYLTRTGYTGEDGFEIYLWNTPLSEPKKAEALWQTILTAGQEYGIKPCGLGSRDTLRLEAGMVLYGNDINEDTTPFEAGLDFAVKLDAKDFIGKEALLRNKEKGAKRIRVGIRSLERGIPHAGNSIWSGDKMVGYITSGTFSPLLKCGIGIGYVSPDERQIGTEVRVKGNKSSIKAAVSVMPFYDETKYGKKRTQPAKMDVKTENSI